MRNASPGNSKKFPLDAAVIRRSQASIRPFRSGSGAGGQMRGFPGHAWRVLAFSLTMP